MYQGAQRGKRALDFEVRVLPPSFPSSQDTENHFINITVAVYCGSQFSLVMKNGEPGRKPPT